MSDFDVYDDEMLKNRFSDQDVERLLSGQMPEDEDLARLTRLLEALHREHPSAPSEDRVARFAARAAEIAASTRPTQAGSAVPVRTPTRSRRFDLALRRKLATGLAALLLLSGLSGVAIASNGAAPGDILYGLDQAMEEVGILDGGASERIAEAQALFNDGQIADAVAHAAEAVQQVEIDGGADANVEVMTSQEASDALISAADQLRAISGGDDEMTIGDDVLLIVAELLGYIAEPGDDTGDAFGQGVTQIAKSIGEHVLANNPGNDTTEEATDNPGSDTADDATDSADDDNADEAGDADSNAEDGLDTADEATEDNPSGRP